MPPRSPEWLRRIYPHNPLYLFSATFVLYGIHRAALAHTAAELTLKTSLLFGYVAMLAVAGWLVIRLGRVWEDGRTILLVVLLMFTAISTSYDLLCLDDPDEGARRLAWAMVFCAAVVEALLLLLRIRLSAYYRVPFYIQLGLLFAFPAVLGRMSVDGHDARMCLGVLGFSVAGAFSLLLLLPAVVRRSMAQGRSGTPWHWPGYPWSIFVFMAVALGVRLWMLSVSFTDAKGLGPAFHPYFVTPILLAVCVLLLQLGITHRQTGLQKTVQLLLLGVVALSFPIGTSAAQERSLQLLEQAIAGPPLLIALAATVVAAYAVLRGVAWGKFTLSVFVLLLSTIGADTRSPDELQFPAPWLWIGLFVAFSVWGIRRQSMPPLSAAAAIALAFVPSQFAADQLARDYWEFASLLWCGWTFSLPLLCRDWVSKWLRVYAPMCLAALGVALLVRQLAPWWQAEGLRSSLALVGMAVLSSVYWFREGVFAHVLATCWLVMAAAASYGSQMVQSLATVDVQRGIAWYAGGCGLLVLAVAVSLLKARFAKQCPAANPPDPDG